MDAFAKRELAANFMLTGDPRFATALIEAEGEEDAINRLFQKATNGGEISAAIGIRTMVVRTAKASGKNKIWHGLVRAFIGGEEAEEALKAHPTVPKEQPKTPANV